MKACRCPVRRAGGLLPGTAAATSAATRTVSIHAAAAPTGPRSPTPPQGCGIAEMAADHGHVCRGRRGHVQAGRPGDEAVASRVDRRRRHRQGAALPVPRHLIARHVQIGVAVDDPAGLHPAAAGSAPCQGRPPPDRRQAAWRQCRCVPPHHRLVRPRRSGDSRGFIVPQAGAIAGVMVVAIDVRLRRPRHRRTPLCAISATEIPASPANGAIGGDNPLSIT
jgi:hypothetical protein